MHVLSHRAVRAFCLYDWANSAFATTILAVVFQTYFVAVVPAEGVQLAGLTVAGDTLWTLAYGLSIALVVLTMPLLGAAADARGSKAKGLLFFCLLGAVASLAMYWVVPGRYWLASALLVVANIGFAGGNVLYNAFLPLVSPPSRMDEVSTWGYAWGYLGGGLLLAWHLALILGHEQLQLSQTEATRLACGSVGCWWLGFGLVALRGLPREPPTGLSARAALTDAWRRLRQTMGTLGGHRSRLVLLLAILLYQNGIQTVIVVAAIVGQQELGLSRASLIGAVLLIQALGVPGSWAMGRSARRWGTRPVLMVSLVLWTLLVSFAAFGLHSAEQYWAMAAVVGLILGGSQGLSRSLYGAAVPPGRQGEFFGFYAMSDKLSALFGPLTYAVARQLTGSIRAATFSLVIFFVVGLALLAWNRHPVTQENQEPAA
jgi:UMF1 family MFS transporter